MGGFWEYWSNKGLVQGNPWRDRAKVINPPHKQPPKAFSKSEVRKILEVFQSKEKWAIYHPYVAFLFATGCRHGEARELRWGDLEYPLNDEEGAVPVACTISRAVNDVHVKGTKTGNTRTFRLAPPIGRILASHRTERDKDDDLIFRNRHGDRISEKVFHQCVWGKVLEIAGVPYRRPYNTRHTFISHALDQGMNEMQLARQCDHSFATQQKHYAGAIDRGIVVSIIPE
jgi:integrase